jgi:Uma2 family endonuclease
MSTLPAPPAGQRLLLSGVDWRTYRRLLRVFAGRPGLRITYDREALEITTTSPKHEHYRRLLGRFIEALTEELAIPLAGYAPMTFRRPRRRGLEPDQCYWITHEAQMRGRDAIDFAVGPPPDLVVEIDITSSSLDRLGACASLRVPEVWRSDGGHLAFLTLQSGGTYAEAAASPTFPWLRSADVAGFLALRGQLDETSLLRQFRAWVRQAAPPPAP